MAAAAAAAGAQLAHRAVRCTARRTVRTAASRTADLQGITGSQSLRVEGFAELCRYGLQTILSQLSSPLDSSWRHFRIGQRTMPARANETACDAFE